MNKRRLLCIFLIIVTAFILHGCLTVSDETTETATGKESVSTTEITTEHKVVIELSGTSILESETSFDNSEQETTMALPSEEEFLEEQITAILQNMTLEEKVYQMFIITPEALTGYKTVTAAGDTTNETLKKYPVGGLIYFAKNLLNAGQTTEMLLNTQTYAKEITGLPIFLCVDEEGGGVARVGNNVGFDVPNVPAMQMITDEKAAYEAGATIGKYLNELGFNLDFAPDTDVITNQLNSVIGDRSFGEDPIIVTKYGAAYSDGLHSCNILSTFKHFPGHGATEGDTHEGFAYTSKTYEELKESELMPFASAKDTGVDVIMVAHISVPNIIGDNTPCTLSYKMITEILRGDLGYDGLVITDAMNMGAITKKYSSETATVMAVKAGTDLILMPENFESAAKSVLAAVANGEISEARIDESVRRIIRVKLNIEQY
ncbi:MAG: glycoside hydrolase family 3 protein [Lachnospiraceae bacterium]|nr:glycoside hydrolase family 3 protein [Lachnospiraceae bacterium]